MAIYSDRRRLEQKYTTFIDRSLIDIAPIKLFFWWRALSILRSSNWAQW